MRPRRFGVRTNGVPRGRKSAREGVTLTPGLLARSPHPIRSPVMPHLSKPLLVLLSALLPLSIASAGGDKLDFVGYMTKMQYFSHKLGLSVDAGNAALQDYYAHEVEEIIEKLEEVDDYKGIPVAKLLKTTLAPAFEKLEDAVEAGEAPAVNAAYDGLLAACNSCHKAANHAYIHVERRSDNPYMQTFAP
jgi:hypothetical protein